MFGKRKHKLQTLKDITSLFAILLLVLSSCQPKVETNVIEPLKVNGNTQGTTYSIIIADTSVEVNQEEIDVLLAEFDQYLSTYIDTSYISRLNASEKSFQFNDAKHYFQDVYQTSKEIYNATEGAFDPSVFPLVAGWGFMKKIESPLDQKTVDSLLTFVSFKEGDLHSIQYYHQMVIINKEDPRFKLDFNAIAQGYAVDVVANFLETKGAQNYYVEIGGELRTSGLNAEGVAWRIGIDKPIEDSEYSTRQLMHIIQVSDKAVATSGNYRNFYEIDGKKYAHTLNPKTGFPVKHNLLSATVIADNCALADGYATAFMVMGVEKTKVFLEEHPEISCYLIYQDDKGALQEFFSTNSLTYFTEE